MSNLNEKYHATAKVKQNNVTYVTFTNKHTSKILDLEQMNEKPQGMKKYSEYRSVSESDDFIGEKLRYRGISCMMGQ